jgi:pimeloyl-ACP methyl ester carboxylesterase
MATLNRNGVKIHYEVHGHGPAILLTHGYGATADMWRGQIEEFASNYKVIVWDMRGHGRSDYPTDAAQYSEALTTQDMKAILDECGAERAVIGGLSLGGYMTLAFHLKYPGVCRALMLFDCGPGFKKDEAREAWNANARTRADRLESEGDAARSTSDEAKMAQHRDTLGLARAARGMLAQTGPHVIESLPSIQVPTLVLAGENDTPFLAGTDYMATKIRNARKVIVPNAGHAANLHNPKAFNAAVHEFLESLPERRPE